MTASRYLLLPKPGLPPQLLDELLRGAGLQRVADQGRGQTRPRLLRWELGSGAMVSTVEYREDHTLGQRQIYGQGPRAAELLQACASRWPCTAPDEALVLAERAETPAAKVATLAPLAVLLSERAVDRDRALAVLARRLQEPMAAVRRAALLVAAHIPGEDGAALLRTVTADPQLAAAAQHQLRLRAQQAENTDEPTEPAALIARAAASLESGDTVAARRWLDRALTEEPLASGAYFLRARTSVADGKTWLAFLDVTTALAVARRQGVRLHAMQELQTGLRGQLAASPSTPVAAEELHAVATLVTLLRLGRWHEVEELASALLPLPGRPAVWWLAIALSRRERGRSDRAGEALTEALACQPRFPAAHFLLGECRRDLGDTPGALREYALLDETGPRSDERPPPPTLADAYADELLGAQAPWESREHAFVRVRLLRECDRPAEALTVTTRLLSREPPAADALLAHGILLAELGRTAEALATLDGAAAALRPEERLLGDEDPLAAIELHRAAALLAQGQPEAAATALRTALRLSPERRATLDPALLALAPAAQHRESHAALRRIARQFPLSEDRDAEPNEPPTGDGPEPADHGVAQAALRALVAELLTAALALLDREADAAAGRALLERARRELGALASLAPALLTARQKTLRALFTALAQVLGVDDPADPLANR